MDFITGIYNIFKFSTEQKKKASADLERIIKAKISYSLINKLPLSKQERIQNVQNPESIESKKIISSIVKQQYSEEEIKEEEKKIIGQIVLTYINFMLEKATDDEKEKVREIFINYNIKV